MGLKNRSFLGYLIPAFLLLYTTHKGVFHFLDLNDKDFFYSLETVYLFFTVAAAIIIFTLLKVKQKNFDSIGLVFLWITSIKLICLVVALRPLILLETPNSTIEKINFFVLFIVFLATETGITIYLLNEKK